MHTNWRLKIDTKIKNVRSQNVRSNDKNNCSKFIIVTENYNYVIVTKKK